MAQSKDALDEGQGESCEPDLATTVGTFANRMQRKIHEQELERDQSAREDKIRQTRLLKAMTSIRKALQDTNKIQLGDRCSFALRVSDWEGWPKVELLLIDSLAEAPVSGLVVTAHDRNGSGRIVFKTIQDVALGLIDMTSSDEFQKLPFMLRRVVRDFLDTTSNYVLNPPAPQELLSQQTKALGLDEETEDESGQLNGQLNGHQFFSDELTSAQDNLVETTAIAPLTFGGARQKV